MFSWRKKRKQNFFYFIVGHLKSKERKSVCVESKDQNELMISLQHLATGSWKQHLKKHENVAVQITC